MYQDNHEITMTLSGILTHKGRKTVHVHFERGAFDKAEGSVPECKITKSSGFSTEEIDQLNAFLQSNINDIMERARLINPLNSFLKS